MSDILNTKEEIISSYEQQIIQYTDSIKKLKKQKSGLAIARLILFLSGVCLIWKYWSSSYLLIPGLLLTAFLFIYLVFLDADRSVSIKNLERFILISQREIDVMNLNLLAYDDGRSFADPEHAYAADLDLFGPFSLFQFLNRCHAEQSRKLLAEYLKTPLVFSLLMDKQAAVKELAANMDWRKQFQSMAMANPISYKTAERLKKWINLPGSGFEKPFWRWLTIFYPLATIGISVLYIMDLLPAGYFISCLLAMFAISSLISNQIQPVYELLSLIQTEMNSLYEQLQLIEKRVFNSSFLNSLKNKLKTDDFSSASASIRVFHKILKRFDMRLNLLVFVFLNAFLLWDLRQLQALNNWKKKNISQLDDWFSVIAEMEVTNSLASLFYNEPAWTFPSVDEKYFHYSGEEIGHPLIPVDKRITNNFSLEGNGKIAMITGSNMAGKSTFLRSLGINILLAQMGAPVCAKRLHLSRVQLFSSMRVSDNLAEHVSTFYAELKKLQTIIEAVNHHEAVFILLDEVLRGTNSNDRHKGSKALIRQLIQNRTVVVMATHDTDLAKSESSVSDSVFNYHFEGKIMHGELFFDYKIKNGICESLNATTLMKKIGIHFQD